MCGIVAHAALTRRRCLPRAPHTDLSVAGCVHVGSVAPFRVRAGLGGVSAPPVIVIADRDAEVRETVRGFMSLRGYRVEQAADAEVAASLLRTSAIDVLISELAMRRADGTALLALARTEAPATRRIAVAASTSVGDREAALEFGAVRVVTKPLSLRELADAIA